MSATPMRPGAWIAASYVLGRAVTTAEPYPHICWTTVTGPLTGETVDLGPKECAACATVTVGRVGGGA